MAEKSKYTKDQKQFIVGLYKKGIVVSKIIEECQFDVSRHTIYTTLCEYDVRPLRKGKTKWITLIGQQFGYLTLINIAHTEKSTSAHSWRAICKCKCGNKYFDTSIQSLRKGSTTSCGCRRDQYMKITGKNSVQFTGYEGISGKYWGLIEKRAINRGNIINIDIKFAWELFLKQNRKCALSGLPIEFAISERKSSETTASLDRIDSSKGYVEDNVQWVYKKINIMKNVFSQKDFIYLCNQVSKKNLNE